MAAHKIITAAFFFLFSFSEATKNGGGFSTSLFHRDSPRSPLHNPSLSRYDRLRNAVLRSFSRAKSLSRLAGAVATETIQSPITPAGGEFLMDIAIGTPPREFIAIADTGSDLTWTQCLPCRQCFNQSQPIFNPRRSSSYRRVPCTINYCTDIENSGCDSVKTCTYSYSYGDNSFTIGELGYDDITLGSAGNHFKLRRTVVGCGHQNGGTFDGAGSGIIGLGGGELSLVSQLKANSNIPRQFSYCLPAKSDGKSTISFGRSAVVSGRGAVSTPLLSGSPDTFYFLTLEAVSVGKTRHSSVKTAAAIDSGERANIIIDSGTTLTFIPDDLYEGMVSTLKRTIRAKRVDDPTGLLDLCYADDGGEIDFPVITVHFTGADVQLPPVNTFAKVSDAVICLTFAPTTSFAIYGNLAQLNFLIGYDLENGRLTFKPSACS